MKVECMMPSPKKKIKKISFGLAKSPTAHPPGSEEKINILRARLEFGIELYHPDDNQIPMHPKNKRGEASVGNSLEDEMPPEDD